MIPPRQPARPGPGERMVHDPPSPPPRADNALDLVAADRFSLDELASIYNATRIDYLVPMPMGPARLAEYMRVYDVDLAASVIVIGPDGPVGLGMLGLRPERAWITRLGVVPAARRGGAGRALMDGLLHTAAERERPVVWLEVIKGNEPAKRLFLRSGFTKTRELLVVRRSPLAQQRPPSLPANFVTAVEALDREQALDLLAARQVRPNWLNETASMHNVRRLEALRVTCSDGGLGWASFDVGRFQLTRIVVQVLAGDPVAVSAATLGAVHQRYPRHDTNIENLAADDPMWPGFQQLGYFDAFRRLEMVRGSEAARLEA